MGERNQYVGQPPGHHRHEQRGPETYARRDPGCAERAEQATNRADRKHDADDSWRQVQSPVHKDQENRKEDVRAEVRRGGAAGDLPDGRVAKNKMNAFPHLTHESAAPRLSCRLWCGLGSSNPPQRDD